MSKSFFIPYPSALIPALLYHQSMKIRPARRVRGSLSVPGDKSISHRAAMIAALAEGPSVINNFSTSEDCASTLSCLKQLGVSIERDGASVSVEGVGLDGLRAPLEALDCGNSGSTMRMLAGVLAGQHFTSELTGDKSLRSRPMKRIIEPLELMGAEVEARQGCAPLRIRGRRPLASISYKMPVASAQVKSCILFAGLNAIDRTEVIETPNETRDHTERMLQWFGVHVSRREISETYSEGISLEGLFQYKGDKGTVPGDISSAAFFIAAAALLPFSKLEIKDVGLNPTRRSVIPVLRGLGVDVRTEVRDSGWLDEDFNEPFGDIQIAGGAGLAPIEQGLSNVISGALTAQLIDELPMLAVVGTQVLGGLKILDAAELRVKETDRIAATVENLRAMGAEVEEHKDGLTIRKRTPLRGALIDSHGDHRIAMAFTVAALIAEGESEIQGAECVGVSFPEFFNLLDSVTER
ncbi:MAG: 3-phosphoshikimate 1-carboxyvinyltransferase [Pyrinomonadaceae bacterium]